MPPKQSSTVQAAVAAVTEPAITSKVVTTKTPAILRRQYNSYQN